MNYHEKYLKYKQKYIELSKLIGSGYDHDEISDLILSIGFEFEFPGTIYPIKLIGKNTDTNTYTYTGLKIEDTFDIYSRFNDPNTKIEAIELTIDTIEDICLWPEVLNLCYIKDQKIDNNFKLELGKKVTLEDLFGDSDSEEETDNIKRKASFDSDNSQLDSLKKVKPLDIKGGEFIRNRNIIIDNNFTQYEDKRTLLSNLEYKYTVYDISDFSNLKISKPNLNIFFYYYAKFLKLISAHFSKYTVVPLDYSTVTPKDNNFPDEIINYYTNYIKHNARLYLPTVISDDIESNFAYIELDKNKKYHNILTNFSRSVYSDGNLPFFSQVTVKINLENINRFIDLLLSESKSPQRTHIKLLSDYKKQEETITDILNNSNTFRNLNNQKHKQMLISFFTINLYERFIIFKKLLLIITSNKDLMEIIKYIENIENKVGNNIRNDFVLRHLEKDVIEKLKTLIGNEILQSIYNQIKHIEIFNYNDPISQINLELLSNYYKTNDNNLKHRNFDVKYENNSYVLFLDSSKFFKIDNFKPTDIQSAKFIANENLKRSEVRFFDVVENDQNIEILIELRVIGNQLIRYEDEIKLYLAN